MGKTAKTQQQLVTEALGLINKATPDLQPMLPGDLELASRNHARTTRKRQRKQAWLLNSAEACRMAVAGFTYQQIADRTGVHVITVTKRVNRYLAATAKNVGTDELRGRQLARLDAMSTALWPALHLGETVTDDDGREQPVAPSYAAIDKLLAIDDRVRKLMGLDIPVTKKVEVTGDITHHAEQRANDLADYMELAEKLSQQGYGSGRTQLEITEGEVADDGDDIDSDSDDDIEDAARIRLDGSIGPSIMDVVDDDSDDDSDFDLDDDDDDLVTDECTCSQQGGLHWPGCPLRDDD